MPSAQPGWLLASLADGEILDRARLMMRQDAEGTHFLLWFAGGDGYSVEFMLDAAGTRVEITWSKPDQLPGNLCTLLLGSVLRYLLQLRGVACLHAGVASLEQGAVAFIGAKHSGKSTTVSSLARLGYPVVSDDIAVLDEREDGFWVQPGGAQVHLWPESLEVFSADWQRLPRALTTDQKRALPLASGGEGEWHLEQNARPLVAIYVLRAFEPVLAAPVVNPLSPAAGLSHLLAHAYTCFVPLDRAARARLFARLGRLAARVPIRALGRPPALDALPTLAALVRDDLARAPLARG